MNCSPQLRAILLLLLFSPLLITGCTTATRKPAVDQGSVFYPMPPGTPRIQFLTRITSEEDLGAKKSRMKEWVTGKSEFTLNLGRPFDVAHGRGKIYVVDRQYATLLVIDLATKEIKPIDFKAGGKLVNPTGLYVTPDDYKFVADTELHKIIVFGPEDTFVRAYDLDKDSQPLDVAVHENRIYVCDGKNEQILVLDRESGDRIEAYGGVGEEEGMFRFPTHLALDQQGNLFVTDVLNSRVQMFDPTGRVLRVIGEPGDFPGSMPRPKGIAVDRDEHLYVIDVAFEMIQIFDAGTTEVLMPFGKFGAEHGGSWLPSGIDVDYDNLEFFKPYLDENFRAEYLIYVANQAGPSKLNVYAFGHWAGAN